MPVMAGGRPWFQVHIEIGLSLGDKHHRMKYSSSSSNRNNNRSDHHAENLKKNRKPKSLQPPPHHPRHYSYHHSSSCPCHKLPVPRPEEQQPQSLPHQNPRHTWDHHARYHRNRSVWDDRREWRGRSAPTLFATGNSNNNNNNNNINPNTANNNNNNNNINGSRNVQPAPAVAGIPVSNRRWNREPEVPMHFRLGDHDMPWSPHPYPGEDASDSDSDTEDEPPSSPQHDTDFRARPENEVRLIMRHSAPVVLSLGHDFDNGPPPRDLNALQEAMMTVDNGLGDDSLPDFADESLGAAMATVGNYDRAWSYDDRAQPENRRYRAFTPRPDEGAASDGPLAWPVARDDEKSFAASVDEQLRSVLVSPMLASEPTLQPQSPEINSETYDNRPSDDGNASPS